MKKVDHETSTDEIILCDCAVQVPTEIVNVGKYFGLL
jgi:hypothetical protein